MWEAKKDLVLEVALGQRWARVTDAARVLHLAWLSIQVLRLSLAPSVQKKNMVIFAWGTTNERQHLPFCKNRT
jgi:hypothetical protein